MKSHSREDDLRRTWRRAERFDCAEMHVARVYVRQPVEIQALGGEQTPGVSAGGLILLL